MYNKIKNINYFNKNSFFIFLIIIIGLFFLLPFYRNDFYISHDAESLIAKTAAIYKSISSGQIPPRWASDMNYGYGAPVLNFYYPLGGYLGSLVYFFGFSFETGYKILIGSFFILSGITFYYYLSLLFKKQIAFGGAVLYMLSPYHLLDLFVRGHIGELIALAISPMVFFIISKNSHKKSAQNIIIGAILYAILILSHNILALLFSIILGFYIICYSRTIKNFVSSTSILVLGLGLSAYFWAPALLEGKYINSKIFVGNYFSQHFIKLENLIYARWGFGPNINEAGGLSPYIGIVQIALVLIALLALRARNNRREIVFWLSVFIISIFFTNEISSFIWSKFHILEQFQFPWRFIAISSFAVAILAAHSLNYLKKNIFVYLTIIAVLLVSTSYIKVKGYVQNDDSFYLTYPGTGAYHGESTTVWTAGDFSSYPEFPVEIVSGEGEISSYERKSNLHEFDIKAESKLVVKDNTVYYPGWRVYVDGKETDIQFQDPNHRGLITFQVPEGEHSIAVRFGETALRLIADIFSLLTLLFIVILILMRKKINKVLEKT